MFAPVTVIRREVATGNDVGRTLDLRGAGVLTGMPNGWVSVALAVEGTVDGKPRLRGRLPHDFQVNVAPMT